MRPIGLSLATSVGYWVALLVQIIYYFSGKSVLKLSFIGLRMKVAADIVKTGYTGAVNTGYQTLRGFVVNVLTIRI